jgi:hypothetical protein
MRFKPFCSDTLNLVNTIAQGNLFCVLFAALLLKVNMDGDGSAGFFTPLVGVMCMVPLVLPVIIKVYFKLGGLSHKEKVMMEKRMGGGD